ncbi:MAG: hypothetical protein ACXVBN_11870 [Flavisolibacter sp.]
MEHLLFAAYLIVFAWLVTRVGFFTRSGLTTSQLIIFFLLKVMAGIFYGWIGVYYGQMAQMVDTWAYHYESVKEYHLLLSHPVDFFTSIFHSSYQEGYTHFLESHNSWWNDLKANFFIKVLALFNVLSFGHYYINLIFYSFLTLFGPIAVYRVMRDVFPSKKIAVLLATFLIPSFIYWTSGLHKEGFIFLGFALVAYHLYFGLKEHHFPVSRLVCLFLGCLLVLVFRNFLILTLLPAMTAWILAARSRFRPLLVFGLVYGLSILVFFTARYVYPALDFPQAVAAKQQDFLNLGGGSAITVSRIQPTVAGFLANAPEAFSLSLIRPYPSDVKHLLSLAAAVEVGILLLFFIIFLFWRKNGVALSPFLLFCLFFSLSVLMMIGYSVNILGAIVRYRSIVFPFLFVPMIARIDWEKISQLLFSNIDNKNNI